MDEATGRSGKAAWPTPEGLARAAEAVGLGIYDPRGGGPQPDEVVSDTIDRWLVGPARDPLEGPGPRVHLYRPGGPVRRVTLDEAVAAVEALATSGHRKAAVAKAWGRRPSG